MVDFKVGDIVRLQDGTSWLVTDKAELDDLSVGKEVAYIQESDFTANIGIPEVAEFETRVFPDWQVASVERRAEDVRI